LGSLVVKGSPYQIGYYQREPFSFEMKCDFHPWMNARILILDHPYMTISAPDGRFEISRVPHGVHSLRIWHELHGYIFRENIALKSDNLDLGTIDFTLSNENKATLGLE
ncbi:MAG: hypothetical protein KDA89_19620, partial [Planctomycetaceae bacterium]|nr:hypothetical protein [Planctomycetaceae bacterium]